MNVYQPNAWTIDSANFALTVFSEVAPAFPTFKLRPLVNAVEDDSPGPCILFAVVKSAGRARQTDLGPGPSRPRRSR
jgi:hypothetical protein